MPMIQFFFQHHYPHSSVVSRIESKLILFTPFFMTNFSFTNIVLLKIAQNYDRQRIFDKTEYFKSKDFTPALKLSTSSACNVHFPCLIVFMNYFSPREGSMEHQLFQYYPALEDITEISHNKNFPEGCALWSSLKQMAIFDRISLILSYRG